MAEESVLMSVSGQRLFEFWYWLTLEGVIWARQKKKMPHIVWAAELLALFTIITRTGYLLVAQIRPHLTLFLSPVMCHFALISSLVLLSAQFYGLFPHFHSLYLSLCHFVDFFFFFSPSPRLSLPADLFISPRMFPLIKSPPWLFRRPVFIARNVSGRHQI